MLNYRLRRQVEKVTEVLSFVASYDPEALIDLHEWFKQISDLARETSQPDVASVAAAASNVSERMIFSSEYNLGSIATLPNQENGMPTEREIKEKIREDLLEELMDITTGFCTSN